MFLTSADRARIKAEGSASAGKSAPSSATAALRMTASSRAQRSGGGKQLLHPKRSIEQRFSADEEAAAQRASSAAIAAACAPQAAAGGSEQRAAAAAAAATSESPSKRPRLFESNAAMDAFLASPTTSSPDDDVHLARNSPPPVSAASSAMAGVLADVHEATAAASAAAADAMADSATPPAATSQVSPAAASSQFAALSPHASSALAPFAQPPLFASGAPISVAGGALAHSYTHTLQADQQALFNQAFQAGMAAAAAYPQQTARGGKRGRAIRTPHAMPHMHATDYLHSPQAAAPAAAHYGRASHMSATPQLDALFNAAPPPHGHPPSYHAAAAGGSDVVDLTQDGAGPVFVNDDDVQVLSHTQGSASSYAPMPAGSHYNAFDPAHSYSTAPNVGHLGEDSYDAYAAAFRSASSSTGYSPSPPPAGASSSPVPLSSDQFASLSREQQAVVMAIMSGKNVFFSGCAGTGKSHLLKLLKQFLPKQTTFFTASTGLAAVNIGGSTLHSFAGVGLGEGSPETLARKAKGGTFFDKLEYVARYVRRKHDEPFGGIQLVLSGDFLQLPPVKATKPTFRADSWERCVQIKIVLTKVFRQLGDPTFINLLSNLRMGVLPLKDEALLKKSHYTQLPDIHGVRATRLNALKKDTASENERHLAALDGDVVLFTARDKWTSEAHMQLLAKDCPAVAQLRLKRGAQVMLLKNIDPANGLCNGSRGIIIDFVAVHLDHGGHDSDEESGGPTTRSAAAAADGRAAAVAAATARDVEMKQQAAAAKGVIYMDENGCTRVTPAGVPAAAAAAASPSAAETSNGLTVGASTMGGSFTSASAVAAAASSPSAAPAAAASSASAAPSVPLINPTPYYDESSNARFGGVLDPAFSNSGATMGALKKGNAEGVYFLPRVQFDNGTTQVIESDKFEIEVQDVVKASRRQIPLTLAWALTIHKSQGMTLDRAEINAQGCFETGQLYVAVSRVKSLQGLRLRGFTRDLLKTDHSVVAWYKRLAVETENSTAELLRDTERYFPRLAESLAKQKEADEAQEKAEREAKALQLASTDPEIHGKGGVIEKYFPPPAAAPAAAAFSVAAASAAAARAPSIAGVKHEAGAAAAPSSAGLAFQRASHLPAAASALASVVKVEPGVVVKQENHAAVLDPRYASPPTRKSVPPQQRVGPPPVAFRSPLRNAAAAAASTAAAEQERQFVNQLNAGGRGGAAPGSASSSPAKGSGNMCCVCQSARAEFVVLHCMHLCLCQECAGNFRAPSSADSPPGVVKQCPVCRTSIHDIKKIFAA